MVNNKLLNKSTFYEKEPENIFSNLYLTGAIIIVAFSFVGYAMYNYMNKLKEDEIKNNSSFYGEDINLYEPLFKEQVNTINECIDMCKNDIICDGITYNDKSQICSGTKNGLLRNETSNYNAWVKPQELKLFEYDKKDFTKTIIVGYTKTKTNISGLKFANPYMLGHFSYSFNLTIYDFYKNYGSWRHIFHKGTSIDDGTLVNYQSWENLVKDFPNQCIGVWLAPFTNNLRISVTTEIETNKNNGSYNHAFVEECNSNTKDCYITDMPGGNWVDRSRQGDNSTTTTKTITHIEFFDNDLQNIPINKNINITINFKGTNVEIYYDGKIVKVVKLDGIPKSNKSNLYVMNDKTFGGEISNLLYYPDSLSYENVNDILKLKA
jgi:hypothetical protein